MSSFDDPSTQEGMAPFDYIAHVIVMPVVLSIGMINQCLNVCTLLHLPSGCFMYLKASAIADILSIICFVPFLLRQAALNDQSWETGMLYHAHVELPLINALITASALNIVAMTVDRYLSVCHPIKFFHASDSKLRSLCVIFCLYFTAFLIYIPSIWQKKIVKVTPDDKKPYYFQIERNHEVEDLQIFRIYLLCRECFTRWGPVIILVVLNMAMVRSLRKLDKRQSKWGRASRLSRSARTRSVRSARDDRGRISALLFVTSTTFIICNLPASFLSLFISNLQFSSSDAYQIFRSISNLLQVTSYLYNFYLYALCSSEYRQALFRLLGCRKANSPISTGDSPTIRNSHNVRRGQIQTVIDLDQVRGVPETVPLNDMH